MGEVYPGSGKSSHQLYPDDFKPLYKNRIKHTGQTHKNYSTQGIYILINFSYENKIKCERDSFKMMS